MRPFVRANCYRRALLRPQLFTFHPLHATPVRVTPPFQRQFSKSSQFLKSSKSPKLQKLPELTEDDKTRIYMIGAGNKESFLALALSLNTPQPPITFIFYKQRRFEDFIKQGRKITVIIDKVTKHEVSGLEAEHSWGPASLSTRMPDGVSNVVDSRETGITSSDRDQGIRSDPKSHYAVPFFELATHDLPPIMNLIITIPSDHVVKQLLHLRPRLRKDSTVLVVQEKGLGLLEKIYEDVFPDPRTRPNFFIGLMYQRLLNIASSNWNNLTRNKNGLGEMLRNQLSVDGDQCFTFLFLPSPAEYDSFCLGPLAVEVDKESELEILKRRKSASFFRGQLLRSPLGAVEKNQVEITNWRMRRLVPSIILGPLAVLMKRGYKDLLSDNSKRALAAELLEESLPILRTVFPSYTLEKLGGWLEKECVMRNGRGLLPPMLADTLLGRSNEIEWQIGWLIRRAKEVHPQIPCSKLETIERMVKEEAAMYKQKIQDEIAARRITKGATRLSDREYDERNKEKIRKRVEAQEMRELKRGFGGNKKSGPRTKGGSTRIVTLHQKMDYAAYWDKGSMPRWFDIYLSIHPFFEKDYPNMPSTEASTIVDPSAGALRRALTDFEYVKLQAGSAFHPRYRGWC